LAQGPNISVVNNVSCTAMRHTVRALQECSAVNLSVTAYRLTSLLNSRPTCRMGQGEQVPGAWAYERLIFFFTVARIVYVS
jgi:hypothetical protein